MISIGPIPLYGLQDLTLILTNNYASMQDNNVNMQQNYADIQEKWNMIDSNS